MGFFLQGNKYTVQTPSDGTSKLVTLTPFLQSIKFSVHSCEAARLVLYPSDNDVSTFYEILLGNSANTKSYIRKHDGEVLATESTPGLLHCEKYRRFW